MEEQAPDLVDVLGVSGVTMAVARAMAQRTVSDVAMAMALDAARRILDELETAYRLLQQAAEASGCEPRLTLRDPIKGHSLTYMPGRPFLIETTLVTIGTGKVAA